MKKIWEGDNLKKIYHQVKDLKLELLLSGLTILMKDTADFINTSGFKDDAIDKFKKAYMATLNHDRFYWEQFGPGLYMTLPDANLPSGIVKEAFKGNFDLEPLKNEDVVSDWTQFPGYYFFKIYTCKVKDIILKASDLEQEKIKVDECKEPEEYVFPLIERLSKQSSFGPGLWYPIMLYISLVLIRSRFVTLKEDDQKSSVDTRITNLQNKSSDIENKLADVEKQLDDLKKDLPAEPKKIIVPKD